MNVLLWSLVGFLSGAVPYSLMVGRLAGVDIRRVGDGNPGATNVLKAHGKGWGFLALALDYFKAAIPVALAHYAYGVGGWGLVPVALAPVLGHAYSPFLRFRGGKAVAATFGTWTALTTWAGPTVLGLMLGYWFSALENSGWAVILALVGLGGYLLLTGVSGPLAAIWMLNAALLAWKYRADLTRVPAPRPWLRRLAGGRAG